MFSAENNSYPALSSYHLSPSLTIPESNDVLLNQSQHILSESPDHLPFLNSSIFENTNIMPHSSTINSSIEAPITQESTVHCPLMSCGKKPSPKKDRHTKISTAQGLRERRVRLSINIAREFFSLQDLLGFDKASKTLGWLLSKSKAAIDEFASCSSNSRSGVTNSINSSSPTSQGEVLAQDVNKDEDKKQVLGGKPSTNKKKRERRGGKDHRNGENVERAMRRAKARERARERTNKKKMIMIGGDHNHNQPLSNHQRARHNLLIHQSRSEAAPQTNTSCLGMMCTQQGMMISVGDKSKSRSSSSYNNNNCDQILSSRLGYQEGFYNHYNNDYIMKLALESSNGGIIPCPPGFSALNIINLSTEIHINAKPWDNRGSQILQ